MHGLTLLGDPWLNPGLAGIAIPFTMAYKPLWTGLGIIGGWLAALLGLSFYFRRRIGPRLLAEGAPGDDRRLRPGRDPHARRGDRRDQPLALLAARVTRAPWIASMFVARAAHGVRKGRERKRAAASGAGSAGDRRDRRAAGATRSPPERSPEDPA